MAATTLQQPGSKFGPCEEPCCHSDCALTKAMAEAVCVYCGKTIGYGVRFFECQTMKTLSHASCEEDAEAAT